MKKFEKKQRDLNEISVEISPPQNDYYEAVSERFGLAQVFLYLLLLAFVAVSLLTNTDLITYQNLYYFVKDLNAAGENVDVLNSDAVSYPTDLSQSFTLYRQGLAVAGNTSVTVFTATGRQTISKNVQYQNPVAVGTGKYLLVYELDGTQYSLYNSYTQIHSGKTDAPIRCAAMSDSGMYAIVTDSEQYASVVRLYSSDFELLNQYRYNGYVTDVAIDQKGNYLSVLMSKTENGAFVTSMNVYEPKKDTVFSQCTVGNGLGLRCGFTESGDVAVLCGNGVYYVSVRGKLITEWAFDGMELTAFDMTRDGCVAVLKKSGNILENRVIVFDKSGKMMYNDVVNQSVQSAVLGSDAVFLMQSEGVLRLDPTDGSATFLECETEGRVLLASDDGRILLCSPQKAVYHRF